MTTTTPKHYKTEGGLTIFPTHIQIPGSSKIGTSNRTIREAVMRDYAQFVKFWGVAIGEASVNPTATFSQLWIGNGAFRENMVMALEALGVSDPETILPTHLQELLMICVVEGEQDIRPAIFRLHSDAPDPKVMGELLNPPQTKTSKTSGLPKSSLLSTLFRWS